MIAWVFALDSALTEMAKGKTQVCWKYH
jgi:hypothetical protein